MARQTMYQTGAKLARLSRVRGMEEEDDGYGLNYDQGPASYYTEEQRNASSKRYDEAIKTLRDIRINSTLASRLNEDVANPQPKIAQIGWGKELKDVKLPGANLPVSERLSEVQLSETEKRAQQYQNIAKDFAATDPTLSNEYFKKALEMKNQAAKEKSDYMALQDKKLEQQADIAGSIVDQDTLDAAIPMLKGLGVNVPKEMMQFNEKSQEYFKSRAMMSSGYRARLAEERQAEDLQRKKEKDAADQKLKEEKLKQESQRIELARQGLEAKLTKAKSSKEIKNAKFDVLAERQNLETTEEGFAALDDGVKTAIASDVLPLAYTIMQEEKMPLYQAKARARKQLLEQIDPATGKYRLAPVAPKASNPQVAQAEAWLKANPNHPSAAKVKAKLESMRGK